MVPLDKRTRAKQLRMMDFLDPPILVKPQTNDGSSRLADPSRPSIADGTLRQLDPSKTAGPDGNRPLDQSKTASPDGNRPLDQSKTASPDGTARPLDPTKTPATDGTYRTADPGKILNDGSSRSLDPAKPTGTDALRPGDTARNPSADGIQRPTDRGPVGTDSISRPSDQNRQLGPDGRPVDLSKQTYPDGIARPSDTPRQAGFDGTRNLDPKGETTKANEQNRVANLDVSPRTNDSNRTIDGATRQLDPNRTTEGAQRTTEPQRNVDGTLRPNESNRAAERGLETSRGTNADGPQRAYEPNRPSEGRNSDTNQRSLDQSRPQDGFNRPLEGQPNSRTFESARGPENKGVDKVSDRTADGAPKSTEQSQRQQDSNATANSEGGRGHDGIRHRHHDQAGRVDAGRMDGGRIADLANRTQDGVVPRNSDASNRLDGSAIRNDGASANRVPADSSQNQAPGRTNIDASTNRTTDTKTDNSANRIIDVRSDSPSLKSSEATIRSSESSRSNEGRTDSPANRVPDYSGSRNNESVPPSHRMNDGGNENRRLDATIKSSDLTNVRAESAKPLDGSGTLRTPESIRPTFDGSRQPAFNVASDMVATQERSRSDQTNPQRTETKSKPLSCRSTGAAKL